MPKISRAGMGKDGTILGCIIYRAWFDYEGNGVTALTPVLTITDPAGANVVLTLNTNWVRFERANVPGDYEIRIAFGRFASLGLYTIQIDSGDPTIPKLVDYLEYYVVPGSVVDATPSSSSFITDLPSSVDNFYADCFLLPITGPASGGAPKKVLTYTGSTKRININALAITPANGDTFYLMRF